ncbi:MAG TPA: FCD domain-containing protein, partial [Casimicrobiaceae bacterium]
DRDFHLLLAKSTRNGSLELVVQGLWNQRAELWGRLQRHFHTDDLTRRTIRDHAAIAAAVEARDAEGARAAMHRHLARVMREFQRNVDATLADAAAPTRNPSRRRKVAPA